MSSVLHIIDGASPQARGVTCALMAESIGRLGTLDQHVLALGGSYLRETLDACGVPRGLVTAISTPMQRAIFAYPAIKAHARRGWPDARRRPSLIHCWTLGSFTLAGLAWPGVPRLLTLTVGPTESGLRWLAAQLGDRRAPAAVLTINATIRRSLLTRGIAPEKVHVLRPGLDLSKVGGGVAARRRELRGGWGVESDRERVIALLSDPPERVDAVPVMMAVGLAAETYAVADNPDKAPAFRVLLHPDQRRRSRAESVQRAVRRGTRFIQDERLDRPWEIMAGCDLAIALGDADRGGGGLSLLWAMAGNVPLLGEATYAVSEILEDRHSALLCKPDNPRAMSNRITQLLADRDQVWKLGDKLRDTARHEAFSYFSRQRYCDSLRTIYAQTLAGAAIEPPAMPSTGGLRFSGRG